MELCHRKWKGQKDLGNDYCIQKGIMILSTNHSPHRPYPRQWSNHDDVIKWKHLPRYWPFVRGIHRSPVNSPHKGQWRWALMFSLICVWINAWVNNREAGDLRRYRAYYDVTVMTSQMRRFTSEWHFIHSKMNTFRCILDNTLTPLNTCVNI